MGAEGDIGKTDFVECSGVVVGIAVHPITDVYLGLSAAVAPVERSIVGAVVGSHRIVGIVDVEAGNAIGGIVGKSNVVPVAVVDGGAAGEGDLVGRAAAAVVGPEIDADVLRIDDAETVGEGVVFPGVGGYGGPGDKTGIVFGGPHPEFHGNTGDIEQGGVGGRAEDAVVSVAVSVRTNAAGITDPGAGYEIVEQIRHTGPDGGIARYDGRLATDFVWIVQAGRAWVGVPSGFKTPPGNYGSLGCGSQVNVKNDGGKPEKTHRYNY